MRLAVYVDTPVDWTLANAEEILKLPFSILYLSVEGSDGRVRWSHMDCRELSHFLPNHKIVPVFWPQPGFGRAYVEWMVKVARWCGRHEIRLDLEGNWLKPTHIDIAGLMREPMIESMTTHLGHPEINAKPTVSRFLRLEVQALSTSSSGKKPGDAQAEGVRRGMQINGEVPGLALAAYRQGGMGIPPREAMGIALKTARDHAVPEVAYWSLKHILGPKANSYARRFLMEDAPRILS